MSPYNYNPLHEQDSISWWAARLDSPLADLAISILSVKASSSNVERLFSFLTWTHSARRNRLEVKTLENLAILKHYFAQENLEGRNTLHQWESIKCWTRCSSLMSKKSMLTLYPNGWRILWSHNQLHLPKRWSSPTSLIYRTDRSI